MRTSQSLTLSLLIGLAAAACADRATTEPLAGSPADMTLVSAASVSQLPPIHVEPLTGRHEFTDDVAIQVRNKPDGRPTTVVNLRDASKVAVLRITVQPGARFPWHTHPGPVLVAVTDGEMVYVYADDCVRRHYPQTAFVDPGFENVHAAYNPSDTDEAVLIATFLGAPVIGPLTIPVTPEQGAALDARCGLEPAAAHVH
jgi:quercetin dioxygenase-like cupin family protein